MTPVLTLPPTPDELQQQMAPRKLHHVAVAVDSVDEALKFYRETLGLEEITVMNLDDRGLKVGADQGRAVRDRAAGAAGPRGRTVARFLDRRGPGLHHVCFEVEDVEKSMRYYEGKGATFLDPVPRPGAVGLVSFMPPSLADGVLVELAQTSGYTFPEPEAEATEEEAPALEITTPILRGPAGYTRHGLVSTSTWGQAQPKAASARARARAAADRLGAAGAGGPDADRARTGRLHAARAGERRADARVAATGRGVCTL